MTFIKKLFSAPEESERHTPTGKRSVSGTVHIPGGKGFRVLREDILQKGLSRRSTEEAA
jgi:hypothetical protein